MPSIKYKKKTYAGSTFPVLEMTKAEYDALPEAKKMDGTVYMITDDTGGWEAEDSAYDNTESGLTATNVQDALDEIATNVVEHTLTLNSGITVNGNVRCFTYGRICFISINNVSFANNGGNQALIDGVPKPIAQVGGSTPKGSNTTDTDLIKNNSCYISAGGTAILFNIGSNNTVRHWINMMYITQ